MFHRIPPGWVASRSAWNSRSSGGRLSGIASDSFKRPNMTACPGVSALVLVGTFAMYATMHTLPDCPEAGPITRQIPKLLANTTSPRFTSRLRRLVVLGETLRERVSPSVARSHPRDGEEGLLCIADQSFYRSDCLLTLVQCAIGVDPHPEEDAALCVLGGVAGMDAYTAEAGDIHKLRHDAPEPVRHGHQHLVTARWDRRPGRELGERELEAVWIFEREAEEITVRVQLAEGPEACVSESRQLEFQDHAASLASRRRTRATRRRKSRRTSTSAIPIVATPSRRNFRLELAWPFDPLLVMNKATGRPPSFG